MRRWSVLAFAFALPALGFGAWRLWPRPAAPAAPVDTAYASSVQPIFDRRCVPCHACFDSPCQLTLQSFDGFDRGANQTIVYLPERTAEAPPTRMFQDAQTTEAWQSKFGFAPVVDRADPRDLPRSTLWRFLTQRTKFPIGASFDVDKTTACPRSLAEVTIELGAHPERGMPFGLPPLTTEETATLESWLRSGAGGPAGAAAPGPVESAEVGKWEAFLNGSDPRTPLVSAYLFEHLFYAHLHLDALPGAWFRVVRSRTPRGTPIDEIPTRRPYDDPGPAPVYYRLRRIRETLVEKTHVPYGLSDAKLARLRQLFFDPSWSAPVASSPYDGRYAANPFVAFAAIPARARYQFLLDDARFHVQTFIHGPVCRGQAALDVIDEHFLILFLAPDSDPSVTDPAVLPRVAADLALPAAEGSKVDALSPSFHVKELTYLDVQLPGVQARTPADVWHGDGTNPDAVLTVFRHFDNAFVTRGAVGGMPKTAWVLDYPIFERMFYDLVAGFDVYGNVAHQLATREYMNLLRIEAEGQFLRLLPVNERTRVHDEWYRGRVAKALSKMHARAYEGPEPGVVYADPAHAKEELLRRLLTRELPATVVGPREPIQWADVPVSTHTVRARFELAMRELANRPAPYVAVFPDTVLVRLKTGAGSDLVYTIARNRSHTSVEFIFAEGVELEPAEDTLQIVGGIITSRPNFFFDLDVEQLDAFVAAFRGLKTGDASWSEFVERYGARRSNPGFWSTFDAFTRAFNALDPIGAAVLDLSRYTND